MSELGKANLFVGLDVGGSAVKLGVLDREGRRGFEGAVPVESGQDMDSVFDGVARELLERGVTGPLLGIGIGVPGLLDRERGRIQKSPNIAELEGFDLTSAVSDRLGVRSDRVWIENDANVAALGELWLGAAKGAADVLLLTLGSGIGGGLILDGRLFVGAGMAGEVGHITIDPEGPPCGCGSHGCLEALASARSASRRAREAALPAEDPGNLELLAEKARRSPGAERELLRDVGRDLGHGLAIVLCLLDLRTFLFGGGFSAALDTLEDGIRQGLLEWAYGERVSQVQILRASLGASAGWIGAARLAMDRSAQ